MRDTLGARMCAGCAECVVATTSPGDTMPFITLGGRKDVGEEQDLFIAERLWNLVNRIVGERNARVVGLQPIDRTAEDPTAIAETQAVATVPAKKGNARTS